MKKFFSPPVFDNPDQTLTARIVHIIAAGMMVLSLIFAIILPFIQEDLKPRAYLFAAIMTPVCIVLLAIIKKGYTRLAGILLTAFLWFIVTAASFTSGGVLAPVFIGYVVVILIGGIVSVTRSGLVAALFCLVAGGIMVVADINGYLPVPRFEYTPLGRFSIYTFFLCLALLLQWVVSMTTSTALTRARESETRYRTLLENIPATTYINDNSMEARTTYISPQVEKLLGYSRKEFSDDPLLWTKILYPEDRDRVMAENQRTVRTRGPFQMEYRLISKDGKTVWVRDEASLVQDGTDEPRYWLGVWSDITDSKLAQEAQARLVNKLTNRTTQLQTAAEVSRAASSMLDINELLPSIVELIRNHFDYYYVGIFLVDDSKEWAVLRAATGEMGAQMLKAGHRLELGNSSMIGWCIVNARARIALDVGEDAVRFKNPLLPLTRSEIALPLTARGQIIGAMTIQSDRPAAFTQPDITALQTMADQIANTIETARLFSERMNLIKELEIRNTELERFSYTVSHDLKSPLVTIRGYLGYLREDVQAGDMARFEKDISRVVSASEKMKTLLNDLLELSRIGRIINAPEDVPMGQLAKETIEMIVGPKENEGLKIEIAGDLPIIHGDRLRLAEVIQNLVSNAVKFMGDQPNPTIQIGTSGPDADGKAILFVRDNGIGIESQYHERIFGLFNRLDPSVEGTGIGLTLVRRIIEVHGGRIWVESEGAGQGSTFYFTLPRS